ncbi:pLS20_p028 family conjugation system transmembrane protein [Priestia filamentosa]|uniref:pLS20_p028 family conjugation system transmembrane protein n=1 Tax=Priestia filamentosa TaxID=1402861 RepID=UPI00397B6D4D
MKDEEIVEKLQTFSDYLEVGNILSYCLRWLGWFLIQALAWLVDGLEGITDSILGIKTFFNSPDVQGFIKDIQPFLYVLLAFSILYIGYLLIMNKKLNREQIMFNLFISIGVIVLLNVGMLKADKFTDEAVDAVDLNEEGTTSEKIIKDGITDIAQIDVNGWKTTDLKKPNKVPQKNIKMIDITEKIDDKFKINKDKELSNDGKDILQKKLALNGEGKEGLAKLDNGWFDFFPEQYYRWHWDFWTIAITLFVTGMTLLFITIKLAKLCYELAFNSILAQLLAPADIADGQKLKQVLKSIMNTFLIIIMIFISMKVYLMGTQFISDKLDGIAYLIALIAISIAVVDGPVMCERIFGIDAGLKSGWAAVAGGVGLAKGIESAMGSVGKGKKALEKLGGLGKSGVGGLSMAGGGMAGMAAGLAKGSGQGQGKQETLPEQMKKATGQGQGKGQQEGQGKGSDLSSHVPGQEQGNGKMEQGQSQAGGLHQGSSLQEEMKAAESKEGGAQGQELSSGLQGEQDSSSTIESEGSGGPGTTSLQDEMKASEGENGVSTTEGASGTQGLSQGQTTLHDEMKAVEGKGGLSSSQGSTSLSNGGAKAVDTPSVQGGSSLQQEVKASGGTQVSKSPANGGSKTVDTPSVQRGSNIQQEMNTSGRTQGFTSSSNGGSQTIDTPSVQGGSSLQQEMNTSGGTQEIPSPSIHGSQTIDTPSPVQSGTTLQQEMPSTENSSSYEAPSEAPSSMPSVTHTSASAPLQEDIRQAEAQVAATQESHTVSSSAPVQNSSQQEVVPASTEEIPMPNQQRTETRHIGQVIRDKAVSTWKESKTVHQTKRTYQIGRNTGAGLRGIVKRDQNKKK